jgi:hypothetical protein
VGKHWRKYSNGPYRLGRLLGEAVVTWRDKAGVKHRFRLGVETEAEGRSALDAFVRKRSLLAATTGKTLDEIFTAYQDDREKDGKLIEAFEANWKALKPTFGRLTPDDITADLCRRYTAERCQKASQGTAWTELTRLRSCCNWAVKKRIITFKPDIWVPQKPAPQDSVLRADADGQKVRKGRSVVPMNDWARVALLDAQKGALSDNVIEWNGEPVKSVRKGFTEAVRRAKLGRDVTPHTLRHTAASWLESGGMPMGRISRFLGHSNEDVTRNIYAKPDAKALEEAAKILDFGAKKSRQT